MKYPEVKFTVNIGAEPVQVIWAEAEHMEEISGLEFDGAIYGFSSSFPQYATYVNCKMPPRTQASTSLHELLHNVSAIFELKLSEKEVRCLEQALCQILSNKDYAQFLTKNLAKQ